MIALCWGGGATAETIRVATFSAPLSRDGPGLLLRDILRGDDPELQAISAVIDRVNPDILVLTDFDFDLDLAALAAFSAQLQDPYAHHFSLRPNSGFATRMDLDGDGRTGDARDAQGYGRFAGDGGLAVLSRLPIAAEDVLDYSGLLWADLPGATLPTLDGAPVLSERAIAIQRLSSTGHWVVPITPADGIPFSLLVFAATPPVFDGPEDRNGLRNKDELRLWAQVLDGQMGPMPDSFILMGNANLDPQAGDGHRAEMAAFLSRADIQDPLPGLATADWGADGPGALRVSYVLPSTDWVVADGGVFWPRPNGQEADILGPDGRAAGPHRLVWIDLEQQ